VKLVSVELLITLFKNQDLNNVVEQDNM